MAKISQGRHAGCMSIMKPVLREESNSALNVLEPSRDGAVRNGKRKSESPPNSPKGEAREILVKRKAGAASGETSEAIHDTFSRAALSESPVLKMSPTTRLDPGAGPSRSPEHSSSPAPASSAGPSEGRSRSITPEKEKLRIAAKERNALYAAANREAASKAAVTRSRARLSMPPLKHAEKAHIGPSKIDGYLLNDNHPGNGGKAKSMADLGFLVQSKVISRMTFAQFRTGVVSIERQLKEQVLTAPAVSREILAKKEQERIKRADKDTVYGKTFDVSAEITGPVDRVTYGRKKRRVETAWIYVHPEKTAPGQVAEVPNLVTVIPKKEKGGGVKDA